jgi:hypothetical protein
MISAFIVTLQSLFSWVHEHADTITAIFTAVIALTGVIALFYAWRQLRESRRQAQIQHLVNFLRDFANEPMVSYRVGAAEEWRKGNRSSTQLVEVLNFFEEIGLLVNRGYLETKDVWEMFSDTVFPIFACCKEQILRDQEHDPNIYVHLAKLHQGLIRIEKAHRGRADYQSSEDIAEFWEEELKAKQGRPPRQRVRRPKSEAQVSLQFEH